MRLCSSYHLLNGLTPSQVCNRDIAYLHDHEFLGRHKNLTLLVVKHYNQTRGIIACNHTSHSFNEPAYIVPIVIVG